MCQRLSDLLLVAGGLRGVCGNQVLSPEKQIETAEHKLLVFWRGGPGLCCRYNRTLEGSERCESLNAHSGIVHEFVTVLEDRNGWCFRVPLLFFLLFLPAHVHELNKLMSCPLPCGQVHARMRIQLPCLTLQVVAKGLPLAWLWAQRAAARSLTNSLCAFLLLLRPSCQPNSVASSTPFEYKKLNC